MVTVLFTAHLNGYRANMLLHRACTDVAAPRRGRYSTVPPQAAVLPCLPFATDRSRRTCRPMLPEGVVWLVWLVWLPATAGPHRQKRCLAGCTLRGHVRM
jgi:hypothetical protein